MVVDIIRNMSDVNACVSLYASVYKPDGLTLDTDKGSETLKRKARSDFTRVVREGSEIIAWINAAEANLPWVSERIFQQNYFASKTSKLKAVKCVKLLHDAMEEYAISKQFDIVMSIGSHQDESCVFSRILEKHGWERQGFLSMKRLTSRHQN